MQVCGDPEDIEPVRSSSRELAEQKVDVTHEYSSIQGRRYATS